VKIDRIETFLVPPRWLFCRIETDDGLVGWGEPVVEGRAEVVRAAVEVATEYLLGADPLRIEDHWQVLTKGGFYRGGPILSSAVAGIDQALWDIAGKARNTPVYSLLGGPVRDRVRMYTWVGGDEPAQIGDSVAGAVATGFSAVKMNGFGRLGRVATAADTAGLVDRVAAARTVLGPDRDVAVDFHGRVSYPTAPRALAALADLHPLFVEEPLPPEYGHQLGHLVAGSPVPVATGERLYSRTDFLPALIAGIAVAQPDLSHAGGISEVRRIGALAETFDVPLAPHCPLGPIALAASLAVDFATPNLLIQEQSMGIHYNTTNDLLDYVTDPTPFRFVDGYALRTDTPGLGIEINEPAVRRAATDPPAWRNPVWRHPDGGLAEW
jgi:galactonate dehydratase